MNRLLERPTVLENPTFYIPEGIEHPQYCVPEEVVWAAVRRWGLNQDGVRVIDPMCGTGTFPRIINTPDQENDGQVGCADGMELDEAYWRIARRDVPVGRMPRSNLTGDIGTRPTQHSGKPRYVMAGGEILLGDCRYLPPPAGLHAYDDLMTSVSFSLHNDLDPWFMAAFIRMLKRNGNIIIDTSEEAWRNGEKIRPRQKIAAYLAGFGFYEVDRISFEVPNPPIPTMDTDFTEIMFSRRGYN